jgi:hypothetical protein
VDIQDVVAARRFVLVDEDGNPRAALMAQRDGHLGVHIMAEANSPPVISIAVDDEDGTPVVLIRRRGPGANSEGVVMLAVTEDGRATIRLEDADGASRTFTT